MHTSPIASLFGTNNETGLIAGSNPGQADNMLLFMPKLLLGRWK